MTLEHRSRTTTGLLRTAAAAAVAAVALLGLVVPAGAAPTAAPKPNSTASAEPTPAAPQTTFGVQPATATAQDARPAFTYGVTPGASLRDHVAILNYSAEPVTLVVYAADGINTDTGGFSLETSSVRPADAGAWVSIGSKSRTVAVPARTKKSPGRVILPVTVRIPADATPGDHVGGIVASLPTVDRSPGGANLTLDQRVASRVYVRVSGALDPRLAVEDVHATYHGSANPVGTGHATVSYVVRNTGNVKLGGRQFVEVSGLLGGARSVVPTDVPLLLPGSEVTVVADISGVLPTVLLNATVTVEPVSASGDVDPQLTSVSHAVHFWAIPWALIALVLLLVLAIAYFIHRRRNRSFVGAPDVVNDRPPIAQEVSTP